METTEIFRPAHGIITIGRSPESTVQIELPTVSWQHARIVQEDGRYLIEDLGSTNGTALGSSENLIKRAAFDIHTDVYFGSYKVPAAKLLMAGKLEIGSLFHDIVFRGESIELGRDPSADIPLDYPMISRRHARLTKAPGGIWVQDLNSRNGTFVEGKRITSRTLVKPGQEIELGTFRFRLTTDGHLQQADNRKGLTIEADGVEVRSNNKDKVLVSPVSFTVLPGELVALMGSSGAGKTTLIKALNGYTRPSRGKVLYNGIDINRNGSFRSQIGYVPQDEIIHPQLTVGEALRYYARLRTDLEGDELEARVREVLNSLDMGSKIDTIIGSPENKVLSGGQRKRVNIALELMCGTPVLFLDEPTSGLSSQDADEVVALLSRISRQENRPIITTIHQPSLRAFRKFDHLLILGADKDQPGTMAFFGPAFPQSIRFFNPDLQINGMPAQDEHLFPEMVLSGLGERKAAEWAERYDSSDFKRKFVDARKMERPRGNQQSASVGASGVGFFNRVQWLVLVARGLQVKRRDRLQTLIVLLQAPLFALLVCLVYFPLHMDPTLVELSSKLAGVHFLMVIAAVWFGCNNAARDIVGEWTIYRRERITGLNIPAYVFSKVTVLFGVCTLQCASLLAIVSSGQHPLRAEVMLGALALAATSVFSPNQEELTNMAKGRTPPKPNSKRYWFIRFYKPALAAAVLLGMLLGRLCSAGFGLDLRADFAPVLIILLVSSMIGVGLGLAISAFSKTNESAVALLPIVLLPIIALGGGMRPIYLIDSNFRWITAVIPSRWSFEANLLQEVKPGGWVGSDGRSAKAPMPDPTDPGQQPDSVADPSQTSTQTDPQTNRHAHSNATTAASDRSASPLLMGDLAEPSIPQYLITWQSADGEKTARAFAGETDNVDGKQTGAVAFRHNWFTSFTVLAGMFFVLIASVLAILTRRDGDAA